MSIKRGSIHCPNCKGLSVNRKKYDGYKGCRFCGIALTYLGERVFNKTAYMSGYVWFTATESWWAIKQVSRLLDDIKEIGNKKE